MILRTNRSERRLLQPIRRIVAASIWRAIGRPFDRRNGVRTEGRRQPTEMTVVGKNTENAYEYAPSPARAFWLSVGSLPLDPKEFTFIDYGSGMGRALLLAGKLNYKRIEGIEFAEELNAVAAQNIEAMFPAPKERSRFQLHTVDAAEYQIPLDPCVIYLYNPFDKIVMKAISDIIINSFIQAPRDIYVVYVNPKFNVCFERQEFKLVEGPWYAKHLDRQVPSGFSIYHLH